MKKIKMKSIDSYGEEQRIEFVYYDTTTICYITDEEGFEFKGVAKLHEGDTYNKLLGEQIAFDKACYKFQKTYQKILREFEAYSSKKLQNKINLMWNRVDKAQNNFKKKQDKLN